MIGKENGEGEKGKEWGNPYCIMENNKTMKTFKKTGNQSSQMLVI